MWAPRVGKTKLWCKKSEQWLPLGILTGRGPEGAFWVVEMLYTLIGVYPFIKRHCTECRKLVYFIVCKSYLNKESIREKMISKRFHLWSAN